MEILQSAVEAVFEVGVPYRKAVRSFERRYLRLLLKKHRGNQCAAAEELGMHRNTLARHMSVLGMNRAKALFETGRRWESRRRA